MGVWWEGTFPLEAHRMEQVEDLGAGPPLQISVPPAKDDTTA